MMKLENELRNKYGTIFDLVMNSPLQIAEEIALHAHRGQKRVDDSDYITHPMHLYFNIKKLFNMEDEDFSNENLLNILGIPFRGTLELCWLHDVVEDTEYTFDEIEDMYRSCGFIDYYNKYIEEPLMLLTHDKKDIYDEYINSILSNLDASLVKFLDLIDNSNPLTLNHLGEKEFTRTQKYLGYIKLINDKYHFIELFYNYRKNLKISGKSIR